MPEHSFNDYLRILEPLYTKKDPAHGLGHIRRVHAKALIFARKRKTDMTVLSLGAALHGAVGDSKPQAEQLLLMAGVPADALEKGIRAAIESQIDSAPETSEGRILHDAHLCEGGDDFLAVKSLSVASFRGYALADSYAWVSENILKNRTRRCYTAEGKAEYARKLRRLREIWGELGEMLYPK
jgi:uncharacterized protein